jgi:hypothetical protein
MTMILTSTGTQCLDVGKDCSGYKTTLTWGVGVASRGKLRGLSLPVANSTRKAAEDDSEHKSQETKSESQTTSPKPTESERTMKMEDTNYYWRMPSSHRASISSCVSSSYIPSAPIPIPSVANHGWDTPLLPDSLDDYVSTSVKSHFMRPPPLQRMASFSPSSFDESIFSAPSTGSIGGFSDSDFPSPHDFPSTPETTHHMEPFINNGMNIFTGPETMKLPQELPLDLFPPFDPNIEAQLNFHMDSFDSHGLDVFFMPNNTSYIPVDGLGITVAGMPYMASPTAQQSQIGSATSAPEQCLNNDPNWAPALSNPFNVGLLPNLTPRMRYLIDYYDKAVCPVLTAVDGPNNPYRVHILALASTSNPALLNAVSAFASNVLHLRTKPGEGYRINPDPSKREACEEALAFKSTSVGLFNAAVRDPAAAHDDSILATLVVLTLFNISEGGLGKLKSQMPGIRQILALRGQNSSQFLHWVTFFYTLLDVTTAVVHDRAAQHRSTTLDILDFSANLGALEHLAHCEARMFKVIARLGPANKLGSWPSETHRPSINPFTGLPMASPLGNMDVNPADDMPSNDARQEIWSSWTQVRSRLRSWSRDPLSCPPTPLFNQTASKPDNEALLVCHTSEVFRHASLLFAERLAFPHIPPSSQQIQHLVSATLHHFSSIPDSSALNRVLLWPLMVAGTECITPNHRDVIRLRCGDAMRESGFFAGLSGLDVLERVWAADDAAWDPQAGMGWESKGHMPLLSSLGGQAGRWRRAMSLLQVDLRLM